MQPLKFSQEVLLFLAICSTLTFCTRAVPSLAAGNERLELTQKDLFEATNWDSTRVDVLGFHLGMTRQEAHENAKRSGLRLVVPDVRGVAICSGEKCELCDAKSVCPGIMLDFDHEGKVVGIDILRIEDAAPVVQKAAIINRFKGKTKLLFSHYSNDLRLRLIGREESRQLPSDQNPLYQGMVTYKYPRLGLNLFVSSNPHGPESTSDLIVSFVVPMVQESH